jgi:hypothetical protein
VATKEAAMADDSGPIGMMGILIGILIVVIIGGGLLLMNGNFGNQSGVTIQLPKVGQSK